VRRGSPAPETLRQAAIVLLVLAGLAFRLTHLDERGSDVLETTRAAIALVLEGGNPYGHGYAESRPPGAPFVYGPLALAWYALLPRAIELIASSVVLVALAATKRLLGLAFFALWQPLAILASDGSNDSSAGLLILGALVLAERAPRWGAAALAMAVAFKPYALAFLPPLIAFGGIGVLLPFVAVSVVAWTPVVALWGLESVLVSFRMAMDIHGAPWYSLAAFLQPPASTRPVFAILQVALGTLASVGSLIWVRSAGSMVAWGVAIYALTLFSGWWSTIAYWAAVAPVAAWHLDGWYGALTSPRSSSGPASASSAGNSPGAGTVPAA
jgi:hypothetical protein